MDGVALNHLYTEKSNQLINVVICTQTLGVVAIFASIVVIVACTVKSNDLKKFCVKEIKYKSVISKQTFLISLSINSLMFLLYAIAMDGAAIHYRDRTFLVDSRNELSHLSFDVLYRLPFVTLTFDLVALVVYIVALIIVILYFCTKVDSKGCSVFTVIPSLSGPLFGLISHSPYIAIAYINDSYYASSIFVYYMVIFFVCFVAIHLTMRACLMTQLPEQAANSNVCSKILGTVGETRTVTSCCLCQRETKNGQVIHDYVCFLCPVVLSFLLLLFLLAIVVTVICYFVIIPLNGSVSGAPHQLIGFYQTVIIFFGIFLTYKTILQKKHGSLKHAVKDYQMKVNGTGITDEMVTDWKNLPGDERVTRFHETVIDLVFHAKNSGGNMGNVGDGDRAAAGNTENVRDGDRDAAGNAENVGDGDRDAAGNAGNVGDGDRAENTGNAIGETNASCSATSITATQTENNVGSIQDEERPGSQTPSKDTSSLHQGAAKLNEQPKESDESSLENVPLLPLADNNHSESKQ